MSERVPVLVPRKVAPSVSAESSTTSEVVRAGDLGDPVPVGKVADQRGDHHRPRLRRDHRLDLVDVDVEGVGLDVDERGHEPEANERRDRRGEGQGGRDHLATRREARELDREIVCARPRVDHDPVRFCEQSSDPRLEVSRTCTPIWVDVRNTCVTAAISSSPCTVWP